VIDGLVEMAAAEVGRGRRRWAADEVHKVRTSSRRLDAALKAYRPLIGRGEVEAVRGVVRPVRRVAGECRDLDVGLKLVAEWRGAGESCAGLAEWLRVQRRAAVKRLAAAATRAAAGRLVSRWQVVRAGVELDDDRKAARFARHRVRQGIARCEELLECAERTLDGARPKGDVHALRLRVKRLRYTVEVLRPAFSKRGAKEAARELEKMQDRLGEAVDAWATAGLVARYSRSVRGGAAGAASLRRALVKDARRLARRGVARARRGLRRVRRVM
jgi:CHAD domain-containing protein